MAYQLQEINDRLRADAKGFVEECEHNYQRRIEAAADRIVANMDKSPIVLLSGPSGSGKTTTALKLEEELERMRQRKVVRMADKVQHVIKRSK